MHIFHQCQTFPSECLLKKELHIEKKYEAEYICKKKKKKSAYHCFILSVRHSDHNSTAVTSWHVAMENSVTQFH